MLISTRGRYALRALVDLAIYARKSYVPMKEIAKRQEISLKYLERIVPVLVKYKLIKGVTGRKGGYQLALPPENIRVGDVLRLTEGPLAPVSCVKKGGCKRASQCPTLSMWRDFENMANIFFNSVTIAHLMSNVPPEAILPGQQTG